ncbi:MAG: hypothetical protein HC875_10390 [Anaerolineales bacterium]|nr:hypothetical protein [Anaerolineales bacterium]
MKIQYISWLVIVLFVGIQTAQVSANEAVIPLQVVDDSTLIYYRLDSSPNSTETCTTNPPITFGDFIKKTLPFEWSDGWANTPNGIEALKAGAIAIRTYALSAYHSAGVINVGGQDYRCIRAWSTRINFHASESISNIINNYPNSVTAVDVTNGIYMTHTNATALLGIKAIHPQFRDETGLYTSQGYFDDNPQTNDPIPWLKEVFDPISSGSPEPGMGQEGSRRWAWGKDGSVQNPGSDFPKWDYRRILAHYYSEVDFVGITPDPPMIIVAISLKWKVFRPMGA